MLTIEQRAELDAVMRRRHGNAALARRARCVVLWSDGERRVDIRSKLACNDEFVSSGRGRSRRRGWPGWCLCIRVARPGRLWPSSMLGF